MAASGEPRRVTVSSPGRLDMMGGVADLSGGLVLEVATQAATTVEAVMIEGEGRDAMTICSPPFGEATLPLGPLRAEPLALSDVRATLAAAGAPVWARYVYGSVAAFVHHTRWLPPRGCWLRLNVSSTVPASQGVSSSASIECAVLRACNELSGVGASPLDIAHLGQAAENHVVGAPCGLMDQLSSMLGVAGKVLPIWCRPDVTLPVVSLPPTVTLVGWPSGVKHDVAASPYMTARTATFMGKKIAEVVLSRRLGYVSELPLSAFLMDVLPCMPSTISGRDFVAQYGGVDDPLSRVEADTVYSVAESLRFPIEETHRCKLALALLAQADAAPPGSDPYRTALTLVGEMMMQAHAGYSAIGLGAPETDAMIRRLMAVDAGVAAGIYGARVSGGGSGGTVVVLCEQSALPLVQRIADAAEHLGGAGAMGGGHVALIA